MCDFQLALSVVAVAAVVGEEDSSEKGEPTLKSYGFLTSGTKYHRAESLGQEPLRQ